MLDKSHSRMTVKGGQEISISIISIGNLLKRLLYSKVRDVAYIVVFSFLALANAIFNPVLKDKNREMTLKIREARRGLTIARKFSVQGKCSTDGRRN